MKIVLFALFVSLVGVINATTSEFFRYAPTISGAQCTLGDDCLLQYGEDLVCSYDRRQEIESLKHYAREKTTVNGQRDLAAEEKLFKVLEHYGQFKLKLKEEWNQVLEEKKLGRLPETRQDGVQVKPDELVELSTDYDKQWSIRMKSNLLDSRRTYECCLEVGVDETYKKGYEFAKDKFINICTTIKFEKYATEEMPIEGEVTNSALENLSQRFNDVVEFVRQYEARHSKSFVRLLIVMIVLISLSTAYCIVTVIIELVCYPRRHYKNQKSYKKQPRVVTEDSFQFDNPCYETTTSTINLPCTISEYLRQIESSPKTSTINIRQQQEIAPPSYMDSMNGTQLNANEYGFNMTMKF